MTNQLPEFAPGPAERTLAGSAATDGELASRAQQGDALAFELIMRRHNRRLFRLARSLLRDDAEAEDVVQETYVRAYGRLGELADRGALAAWLARIAANEALGRLRAGARVVSLEEHRARTRGDDEDAADGPACDRPDPERLAASGELRRLLEAAVDELPEEFRAVFVLREVEGLSTAETAACLGIRPETVKTRLHRARRMLQDALGGRLLALSPSLFEFEGRRCDRLVAGVLARRGADARRGPAARLAPPPAAGSSAPAAPAAPRPRWFDQLLAYLERRRKP